MEILYKNNIGICFFCSISQAWNLCCLTNNLEIISRAAEVLEVPLALLVGYVDEPDIFEMPVLVPDEDLYIYTNRERYI